MHAHVTAANGGSAHVDAKEAEALHTPSGSLGRSHMDVALCLTSQVSFGARDDGMRGLPHCSHMTTCENTRWQSSAVTPGLRRSTHPRFNLVHEFAYGSKAMTSFSSCSPVTMSSLRIKRGLSS
eukprot:scaffold75199_cov36-Tisochrysis_lutea.AAC.2